MKPAPGLKGRAWTTEDDERLKSLIEANVSIHLIAAKMKRRAQGVKSRAHVLGISTKRVWVGLIESEMKLVPGIMSPRNGL
jgi:hypothetical protein